MGGALRASGAVGRGQGFSCQRLLAELEAVEHMMDGVSYTAGQTLRVLRGEGAGQKRSTASHIKVTYGLHTHVRGVASL